MIFKLHHAYSDGIGLASLFLTATECAGKTKFI